jgi:EpsI family protein
MSSNSIDRGGVGGFVWRLSLGPILIAAAVAGLSLWLFWDGLWFLGSIWTTSPEYSYCILIPPIAMFLIWQQKGRLELMPFEGSWWGVVLVLVGGGLLILGQLATIYTLVQYAYLVTLYGLVLAFTGRPAFRLLGVPMLILAFMIPLPAFFFYNLSAKLQLLSSALGVWFMRLFGISVFVEGNVIDLGGYQLQVAEACDGLRYLFPLMTLGFLMAHFYKGAMWQRKLSPAFIAAGAVLVTFVGIAIMLPRPAEIVPGRVSFIEFPLNLGTWTGQRRSLEGIYLDQLKLDDYLLVDYFDNGGHAVNLYVSYYNSQRKGDAVHSPRACLPGGGWQLRDFDQRTLAGVMIDGRELRVNRTLIELGNQRQLVYYWFQQRGRIVTNEFSVKWYLFWDALTRHRTDGAMIRIIANVPSGTDVAAADGVLTRFAAQIAPQVPRYVPN